MYNECTLKRRERMGASRFENLQVNSLMGNTENKETQTPESYLEQGEKSLREFLETMVTIFWARACARHRVENF